MSTETVRSGFDTWAGSAKPTLEHPRETSLPLKSGASEAFLYFKSPAPRGSTVTSATLTLRARGASSGSRTLTVGRVNASWKEARLNWGNRPGVTGTTATQAIGTLADRDTITVNVTSLVQAWASGSSNYGFRITTSAGTTHSLYSLNSAYKPTLTVTWSDAPSQPTNLRPSAAHTGLAKPHVLFDYLDFGGDTSVAAVQVQIASTATGWAKTTGFPTPTYDSLEQASTAAGLDLAAVTSPAFGGITAGATVYWTVRVKDGSGLWSVWADPVSMTYTAKPALAISNLGSGIVYEPTPPIAWTYAGTLKRWQVLVYNKATGRLVYDSKERTGSALAHTIPSGYLKDGVTYTAEVRGWDDKVRETTPNDDVFSASRADFYLATSSSVPPVATLTATQPDTTPAVTLTWTRDSTPDEFVVLRDGKPIKTLTATDVFVSGSTYRWTYWGARPNRQHTYAVRAVTTGTGQSADGPTASLTTSPSGLWLVDEGRGVFVALWGNEDGTWNMPDDAAVYTPVGSTKVVRIVSGMRGLEGNLSGLLMEGFGKTYEQQEADLYAIKSRPTDTVRIIAGDENFSALIGNLRMSPKPETRQGRIVKGVSFDFWQVGTLPFDPEI